MNFDEAAVEALEDIYSTALFGVTAVFSPILGEDVACTVIIDMDNNWQPGGVVQITEPQITINYRRSDIDRKVKRGEKFTIGSSEYTVVSMAHYPGSWNEYEGQAVVTDTTI